ncbi:MAG: hypothetical protein SD837_00240 [Candidatus Electrothrix scaldis]|nr:MAG: hypothetical protein SD837_00240 [Candidatus Electrothrix sp. GW3-3]
MKYQLFSSGRLLAGSEEKESIARIQRITKLSAEQIRKSLLNGKPKKLLASDDKEKIKRAALAFHKAGLEVKVQISQAPAHAPPAEAKKNDDPGNIAPNKEKGPPEKVRIDTVPRSAASNRTKKKRSYARCLLSFLLFLIILVGGASGYAWYWLHRPLPAGVLAAEQALFDGNLIIAGLIDVKKLTLLERYWFGELDPQALPLETRQQGLLNNLLSGPPKFRENLSHIFYATSMPPGQEQGTQILLLTGKFDAQTLLKTLGKSFKTEQIDTKRWQLTPLSPADSSAANAACADKTPQNTETASKQLYIHITPDRVMFFSDLPYAEHIWDRLASGQQAEQDPSRWQHYRQGKFISFMLIRPGQTGKAIGGIPGLMAQGALTNTPQVQEIALGLEADPRKGGLNTNLHVNSKDAIWNASTATGIQQKINALQQDTRSTTPTLAAVLARIKPSSGSNGLDIDVRVDSQLLDDLTTVLQEGINSIFMGMSGGNTNGGENAEQINEKPATYQNIDLKTLPDYRNDAFQSEPPLFIDGPFAVDLKSISPDKAGIMNLKLEGKVQLPENTDDGFNNRGKLTMQILSVQDTSGQELLRDEHCMSRSELSGLSPNHEPESNMISWQDQSRVQKHVRLKADTPVEQLHKITGQLSFSVPTRVRKISVPLRAGEVVEQAGLRFYLNSIKKNAITYQISGNTSRLLEIRGLNKAGQVLQQGWLMGDQNKGRATQNFSGQIEGLEIFIAENFFEKKSKFALSNLFQAKAADKKGKEPAWFAPEKINLKDWNAYKKLNLKKLLINPEKDWYLSNKQTKPIAEGSWSPIRLFITHTPKEWGNNPIAHLYFPQLQDLPGVLSGLSSRIAVPAPKKGPKLRYHQTSYWYNSTTGEILQKHLVQGKPFALNSFPLITGLAEKQKLDRLKGELIFRLPQKTHVEQFALKELWAGQSKEGITVTLTEVGRGTFPGYSLKVEGALEKLVNLHGIGADGERVLASPINFQESGYWTMTLPFGRGIKNIELVIATEQKVLHYPFDFKAKYPKE